MRACELVICVDEPAQQAGTIDTWCAGAAWHWLLHLWAACESRY